MNDEIIPHAFTKLGGKTRPGDIRDHAEAALPEGGAAMNPTPSAFMQQTAWETFIHYQGQRPACGAHALASAKQILDANDGKVSPKKTPRFSWIDIKKNGSDANPSDGSDMRSILQSAKNTGVDDFEPLENDVTYDDADYASPKFITQPMLTAAGLDAIDSYTFTDGPYAFQQIKDLIWQNKVVIALIQVGDTFWTAPSGQTSWAEADICPIRPPAAVIDGHFIVLHSFDENYIYFTNSFGQTWGRKGHGYIGPHYPPYVVELGFPKNAAAPVTAPAIAQVVSQELPQVQKEINELPAIPQPQRSSLIQAIGNLLSYLSGLLK